MSDKPITDRFPALIDLFPTFIDWPTTDFDKYGNFDWQEVYDVLKAIETALGYITAFVGLYRSAVQSIPNATWTSVSFDQEVQDIGDYHEGVTNPSRITISAATAGHHTITFAAHYAVSGAGTRQTRVLKNGVAVVAITPIVNGDPANPIIQQLYFPAFASAPADYFELQVYQNSGGATGTNFAAKRLAG